MISDERQYMDFLGGMFNLTAKEKEYAAVLLKVLGRGELNAANRIKFAEGANISMGAVYVWIKKFREKKLLMGSGFNPVICNTKSYIVEIDIWTKGKFATKG